MGVYSDIKLTYCEEIYLFQGKSVLKNDTIATYLTQFHSNTLQSVNTVMSQTPLIPRLAVCQKSLSCEQSCRAGSTTFLCQHSSGILLQDVSSKKPPHRHSSMCSTHMIHTGRYCSARQEHSLIWRTNISSVHSPLQAHTSLQRKTFAQCWCCKIRCCKIYIAMEKKA